MEIRSRAPLRIGLAGGGTDLPAYSNRYGGAVFNATIGMYAYCTIIPTDDNRIKIFFRLYSNIFYIFYSIPLIDIVVSDIKILPTFYIS